jgi:hypothetical protein
MHKTFATELPTSNGHTNHTLEHIPEATGDELLPGSEHFNIKNNRRFQLIDKKVDVGLSPDEEKEFQILQEEILRVTGEKFPRPLLKLPTTAVDKEGA